ncbi:CPCC family cysteine-rich protein [Natronomonas marina]|jgi:hypothetical protein|uniref:CPCC family cysteine-rich protein n=1 Tax=Natronomonas marina TaxID=2961939 RepID=UPI0020C981ED|nr:CPCC family cysteine-rich protein [Natronomonas marina]
MADRGGPRRNDRDGNPVSRELGFCPCCGYRTLSPSQPGSYEVCEICGWLDDLVGFYHPETQSDYNHVSLSAARENVAEYGACLPGVAAETRDPDDGDERDPNYPYE